MSEINNPLAKMLAILNAFDEHDIPFYLEHHSEEALLATVSIDNERWEIEFYTDGEVQVEVFYSDPDTGIEGEEALLRLFEKCDVVIEDDE